MSFTDGICEGLENIFSTKGRMSRSAFWWYALFCILVIAALCMIVALVNGPGPGSAQFINILCDFGLLYVVTVPGIRRLHDIDKSGNNVLWILLPVIGWIYLIYLYCKPSDPEDNYYGETTL